MEIPVLAKILREYSFFAEVADEEWPELLAGHRFQNFHHHETLVSAGENADRFALVLTGAFKLVRPTPRGEDAIVYFATPGEVVGGLVMMMPQGRFPISAIALGPSTALLLPRATYVKAWARNVGIQVKLNGALFSRMSTLQEDKANSKLSLAQRIASLLLSLLDKQDPAVKDSRLPILLTRQEIADAVGSTVESVIRCMSDLAQKGLVQTEDRQIEILRADKLIELLKQG